MELKAFWTIVTRWRRLIAAITAAASLSSGILAVISPPGYASAVVDDFTKIAEGRLFAEGVARRLTFSMDPRQIQAGLAARKQANHILSIRVSAPTEDQALALAQAAADEIRLSGQSYFATLNTPELSVTVVDNAVTDGINGRSLQVALIAGRIPDGPGCGAWAGAPAELPG